MGSVGALTTFTLGEVMVPWVVGVVCGGVLLFELRLRQKRKREGTGRHAAW